MSWLGKILDWFERQERPTDLWSEPFDEAAPAPTAAVEQSHEWAVHIAGPDDVFAVSNYDEAIRVSSRFNAWWTAYWLASDKSENAPRMWASPAWMIFDADAHAASLASPPEDYAPFLAQPQEAQP